MLRTHDVPTGAAARRRRRLGVLPHRLHQQRRRTPTPGRERRRQAGRRTTTRRARRSPSASPAPRPTTAGSPPSPTTPRAQAEKYSDVDARGRRGHQRRQPADRPDRDPDQREGRRHRAAARRRQGAHRRSASRRCSAGIPVINLDRDVRPPAAPYRCWINGDNYGMGVSAGHYIGEQLKDKGIANPVIAEIAGIDALPLTQDRSQGLRRRAKATAARRSATGSPPSSPSSPARRTANLLQAAPKIDALWNHDDDQGVGVAGGDRAGRPRRVLHGRRRRLGERDATPSRPTTRC